MEPERWNYIRQCMKCWHKWELGTYLRLDGEERNHCPNCNSNQVLSTRKNPTKIVTREDLSMLTYELYPEKYCPKTSLEELYGSSEREEFGLVARKGNVSLVVSRGFGDPHLGHYAILYINRRNWMCTDSNETESMNASIKECPENARVFIGGLGLGLILLQLAKTNKVKEVLVAEINQNVIDIVEPRIKWWFNSHYPNFNFQVICGDALEEVTKHGLFNWIFFDIWRNRSVSEGEPTVEQIRSIATSYLTERGKLTTWIEAVEGMEKEKHPPIGMKINLFGRTVKI